MKVKDLFRNRKFNTDLSEEEILNEFEKYIKLKNFLKKDEEFELYQKPSLVAKIMYIAIPILIFLLISIGIFWGISLAIFRENYSNGERIGLVTNFSKSGVFWKSWEGELNLTQTGMNSNGFKPFKFSIDNDKEQSELIAKIDSAVTFGWKVKLVYHQTFGWNWFNNRGETNYFVTDCLMIDRNPVKSVFNNLEIKK